MDFPSLRRYIIDEGNADAAHALRFQRKGACLCGGPEHHRANSTLALERMIKSGVLNKSALNNLPMPVSAEMDLLVLKFSKPERVAFITTCKKAMVQERHANTRAFAQSQMQKCMQMGLPESLAIQVMRVAHPTYMVEAAEWARDALRVFLRRTADLSIARDSLNSLLSEFTGADGSDYKRFKDIIDLFGWPPLRYELNPRAFSCVLRGAHEIVKHLADDPSVLLTSAQEEVT